MEHFKKSNKPKLIKTYEELKKQVEQHDPKTPKITMGMVKPSPQKDYLLNVVLYSDTPNFTGQKPWQGLFMMFPKDSHRQYQVKAPKIFPQSIMRRVVRRDRTKREANLFKLGIKIFSTDEEFAELFDKKGHYIIAFKIFSADSIEPTKSKHKPLEKNLKDAQKMSMNCKYIKTNIDTSFDTFVEAIAKKHHVVNECWLNRSSSNRLQILSKFSCGVNFCAGMLRSI